MGINFIFTASVGLSKDNVYWHRLYSCSFILSSEFCFFYLGIQITIPNMLAIQQKRPKLCHFAGRCGVSVCVVGGYNHLLDDYVTY